jgi:pyrroline-5-carboxylate reductase
MQITFIGGGNMATAIIGGLHQQGGHRIHVVDPTPPSWPN